MRILHIIHSIDRRSGGPSHALRGLVEAQVRDGQDVSILTTTTQSAEPWAPQPDYIRLTKSEPVFYDVDIHLGNSYGRHRPWSRFAYSRDCRKWLHARLSDPGKSPDIIHIHGLFSHLSSISATLAIKYGIPYILRPAGSLSPVSIEQKNVHAKRLFIQLIHKRHFREAAFIHATSHSEKDEIERVAPNASIETIPHGVPIPQECESKTREVFYDTFPLLRNKRTILFLARVDKKKRPILLIDAVRKLREQYPDTILIIAGSDAGHLEAVKDHVSSCGLQDMVLFTGFLSGSMKEAAFEIADVYALTSEHENYGVSVVEAMSYGTPVVVTQGVASHVHVIESGGGIVADDTVDSVCSGLSVIMKQGNSECGISAKEYVAHNLSWESMSRALLSHYRSAIDNRSTEIAEKEDFER